MRKNVMFDKSLRIKKEIPVDSFLFLFSEIVHHCIKTNPQDIERQLEEIGYPLGARFLELITLRDYNSKKEIKVENFLFYITGTVWPVVFNKNKCVIERHTEKDYIYMIKEENSLCNRYACLQRGVKNINCSAFTAGIIEGMLNAAGFPARVTALFESEDTRNEKNVEKTVYLIHFAHEVIDRMKELTD